MWHLSISKFLRIDSHLLLSVQVYHLFNYLMPWYLLISTTWNCAGAGAVAEVSHVALLITSSKPRVSVSTAIDRSSSATIYWEIKIIWIWWWLWAANLQDLCPFRSFTVTVISTRLLVDSLLSLNNSFHRVPVVEGRAVKVSAGRYRKITVLIHMFRMMVENRNPRDIIPMFRYSVWWTLAFITEMISIPHSKCSGM